MTNDEQAIAIPSGEQGERGFQWTMTVSQMKAFAAELTLAAETMGGDDDESADIELILSAAKPGTVRDDDSETNSTPILTVHLAEYPEEGVYPIDPCDPTAGRDAAPAAGDAQHASLSNDELREFLDTVDQFGDCGETTTVDATLMRWASMGLLECTHYEVTDKGRELVDAALQRQEVHAE